MRFAIVGAGAVGGYFGAKLVQAGHEVTFLARGAHLEALRQKGLEVRGAAGDARVPVRAESDAARVGPVDVVLLAVKTYDIAGALPVVKTLVAAPGTPALGGATAVVLTLQNGVDSPDEVASAVGREAVLGGSAYISAAITEPGVLTQTGTHQRITLGEFFGDTTRVSPRVATLRDALAGAGINTDAVADARVPLWDKLVFLAPFAGLTGATRLPIGVLRTCAPSLDTYKEAASEVIRVAAAEGVTVKRTPESLERELHGLPPQTRASLLVDLEQGKRLEVEALLGSVMRRGRAAGVPTPVLATLYGVLSPYASGQPQG
ncbi:ketopantoate reductase family protein [Vitiosangium sp. GDMCC 1.1324]|uniref:ketopantoate reductase family protein n=1 Tax=Vitiosangium sp. (strain GDMCC 1.1324) TaxID=2138576 RepID=UPI000D3AF7CF|nr:2-dehydropantoate 2-reductase [Vitiosangium sp. GDMCC 1.1324]PTL84683.1 2-dehydropantoate 2-reductase [Vitiosangium sp. GDMCC 1.1324]